MKWKYMIFVVFWGIVATGCNNNSTRESNNKQTPKGNNVSQENGYSFPKLKNIISLEYMKHDNPSWHPIANKLWPTIVDCFCDNKKYHQICMDFGDDFVHRHPPGFDFYLQIKLSTGKTVLLSLYNDRAFIVDRDKMSPYLFNEANGKRLYKILNGELKTSEERTEGSTG